MSIPPEKTNGPPEGVKAGSNGAEPQLAARGVSAAAAGSLTMDVDEEHPPGKVMELAANCVRFVLAKLKIELDFEADTLPLLDHYVSEARSAIDQRPETLALTAHTAGAYLGEVARRRHACWWRLDPRDASAWRLEFRNVYLCFYPVQVAYAALTREDGNAACSGFELPAEDMDGLLERLEELPPVSEDEYYAPSTRLEILDIAVDALLAKRATSPYVARPYAPSDYEAGGELAP